LDVSLAYVLFSPFFFPFLLPSKLVPLAAPKMSITCIGEACILKATQLGNESIYRELFSSACSDALSLVFPYFLLFSHKIRTNTW
jgi:hypothetical protein